MYSFCSISRACPYITTVKQNLIHHCIYDFPHTWGPCMRGICFFFVFYLSLHIMITEKSSFRDSQNIFKDIFRYSPTVDECEEWFSARCQEKPGRIWCCTSIWIHIGWEKVCASLVKSDTCWVASASYIYVINFCQHKRQTLKISEMLHYWYLI